MLGELGEHALGTRSALHPLAERFGEYLFNIGLHLHNLRLGPHFRLLRFDIFLRPIKKVMPHAVGAHQVDFHLGIYMMEGANQT